MELLKEMCVANVIGEIVVAQIKNDEVSYKRNYDKLLNDYHMSREDISYWIAFVNSMIDNKNES